eukprot:CAMPEP_0119561536 /NCGR_PEP_ID=MMETSP1352-20130426/17892_1 /TAXON_ID=265584 /ORGANISM="Stauroneis constricta, Strain CCMP1120" /LENGTH=322 /DNA_ID=CAMNT_0007609757 /DNA_START=119 /DNA_END=1087 /DNA_ORIENTATION=+
MTISEASIDFIAGWCSGAVGVLTCQPIDTILTRFQAGPLVSASSTAARPPLTAAAAIQVQTQRLVNTGGMRALWRGSSAMIGAVPLQNALLMGGYGIGKQYSAAVDKESESAHGDGRKQPNAHVLMSVFVGGCVGGVVQSFLMSPVELVKVHQQVNSTRMAQAVGMDVLRGLVSSPQRSWRGLSATLLRDGVPHGVWFASYEYSKTVLGEHYQKGTTGQQLAVPLISGGIAATVAWGVGYPFDLIKTRMQASAVAENVDTTSGSHGSHPKGVIATAKELIAESNGRVVPGLYRGFGLKLARAIPASMIGFVAYEFVADQLRY